MSRKILKPVLMVGAIVAAAATGGALIPLLGAGGLGLGAATAAALSTALMTAGIGVATNLIGKVLGLSPKAPGISSSARDRLFASLVPDTPRAFVLGRTAMATDVRYQAFTSNQEYYHQILCVAAHQVEAIEELWFDTTLAWTAAGGVQSKYAGYLTVSPKLVGHGGNTATIDGKWGANQKLTGCAYLHLRFKLTGNNKKAESPFSQSIPTRVTVRGKGALMYDPRFDSTVGGSGAQRANNQATWAFSPSGVDSGNNPALQLLWYLLGWRIQNPSTGAWKLSVGRGFPADRIDMGSFITAANLCDEPVTKAAGGTEPRYRSAQVFTEGDDPALVIGNLCASMNAVLRDAGGKITLSVLHNDLGAPVAHFTEADILGNESWKQTPPIDQTYNVVRGRYTDPSNGALYQLVDFPEVVLPSFDGIERVDTFDLPMVESPSQAQRLAKQRLQRNQYQGLYSADFGVRAWQVSLGDVVTLSHISLGWVNKLFRVVAHGIAVNGIVPMILQEEHPDIYQWDKNESPAVDVAVPTEYDPTQSAIVLALAEAGGTADWPNVADPDGTRPEDNATVGAPPGTPVGNTPAEQVEEAANAVNDPITGLAAQKVRLDDLLVDVDELKDTYGSTASAAQSAADANAAKLETIQQRALAEAAAGQAEESETLAATSLSAMNLEIAKQLPANVTAREHYSSAVLGSPETIATTAKPLVDDPDFGKALEAVFATPSGNSDTAAKGVVPVVAGRVYEFVLRWKQTSGALVAVSHQPRIMDAAFSSLGTTGNSVTPSALNVPQESRLIVVCDTLLASSPTAKFLRPAVRNVTGTVGTFRYGAIYVRDVTDREAGKSFAAAALSSMQSAEAEADASGQSAQAAQAERALAQTAKGQAEAARDIAVASKEDAEGAAASAVLSQTLTATARDATVQTAINLVPRRFDQDGLFWSSNYTQYPSPDLTAEWTFVDTGTAQGRVARLFNTWGAIIPKGHTRVRAGGSYKIRAILRVLSDNTAGTAGHNLRVYLPIYDGAKAYLNRLLKYSNPIPVGTVWQHLEFNFTGDEVLAVSANTVFAKPYIEPRDGAGSSSSWNGHLQIAELWIEDVTESTKAGAFAQASESSSVLAGTQAAAALASAKLAAQIGGGTLTKNPTFADWSTGDPLPFGWSAYSSGITRSKYSPGQFSPNGVLDVADGVNNGGLRQDHLDAGPGLYKAEASIELTAGSLLGSGLLVHGLDANGNTTLALEYKFNGAVTAGGIAVGTGTSLRSRLLNFSVSALMPVGTTQIRLYGMDNYTSFGEGVSAKTIIWHKLQLSPANSLEAAVTNEAGAIVEVGKRAMSFLQIATGVTGLGNGATAAIQLKSEVVAGQAPTSQVALIAQEIMLGNETAPGLVSKAMSVVGGNVLIYANLNVGASVRVGTRNIAVALQAFSLTATDGQNVTFGTNLGNVPQIVFDTSGLPTGSYDIRALNLTPTGFTMYAKSVTPATPSSVTSTGGTNVGGTPQWRMHKSSAADSSNGYYTFSASGSSQVFTTGMDSGEGMIYLDCYIKAGGAWQLVGTLSQDVSAFGSKGSYTVPWSLSGAVYYGNAVGQDAGGDHEFGVSVRKSGAATLASITSFGSVTYPTQGTSGSTTSVAQAIPVRVIPQNS